MLKRLSLLFVLVAVILACGTQTVDAPPASPATNTPVPPPANTAPPAPTDTPIPTPDYAATEAAELAAAAQQKIAVIDEILQEYNLSTSQGSLGWVQDQPIEIRTDSYGEVSYVPVSGEDEYSNFVLSVSIDWDSSSGVAGCGIMFRAENNVQKGEQYRFLTLRLSGLPAWDVEYYNNGNYQSTVTGQVMKNSAIDNDSGATNQYVLVVEDKTLVAYANEQKLSSVNITKLNTGRIAFLTWQESGESSCNFYDGWIWDLGD
ncbi:MAG: hypothetical protein OEZ02_13845 [Anaerolineae bacterium]|nr:hypothetical protein [Anaerolineae bacterium]